MTISKLKPLVLPLAKETATFDGLDPLDGRYYDPEIARALSERSRVAYQAYVEAALAQTLADFGVCNRTAANAIEAAASKITIEAVYREEQTTKHDIKALVNCIKAKVPAPAKPYVHFGATSYDIIVNAQSLQMRDAMQHVVIPRLQTLLSNLITIAEQYGKTTQIGRTHGQHALPITFGFAISEYVSRLGNSIQALEALTDELTGKFSGAVGAYNALSVFIKDPLEFEKSLLAKLQLRVAPYSTQIAPPETTIRLIDELTITAGIMANLSHDMRHLQRTEIAEVQERFEKGQTGSSTMAHKRNPWNFENIISMHKQLVGQMVNANLNIASEHQRDLTDSASSRFFAIVPASVASMASRLDRVMQKLEVNELNMQRNLQLTGGAIAAEPLYLLFAKYGHTKAHELSKALSHRALSEGITLVEAIETDAAAHKYWLQFSTQEQRIIAAPEKYYTGLAAQKAATICRQWRGYLKRI